MRAGLERFFSFLSPKHMIGGRVGGGLELLYEPEVSFFPVSRFIMHGKGNRSAKCLDTFMRYRASITAWLLWCV